MKRFEHCELLRLASRQVKHTTGFGILRLNLCIWFCCGKGCRGPSTLNLVEFRAALSIFAPIVLRSLEYEAWGRLARIPVIAGERWRWPHVFDFVR